jgi:hypothetical protein
VYTHANTERYEGDWVNDKMTGKGKIPAYFLGKYEYKDGSNFDGEWKDNLRHGKGKNVK